MPAYSFNERFVPMVVDGSKRQTIRAFRLRQVPRIGQKAHLFFGMRTKNCRKLVENSPEIKDVKLILITAFQEVILFNAPLEIREEIRTSYKKISPFILKKIVPEYVYLLNEEKWKLAFDDGFRYTGNREWDKPCLEDWELMIKYWTKTQSLPFLGEIIYW